MDIYTEYIVKHKKTASDYLIIVGSVLGALVLTLVLFALNRYILGMAFIFVVFIWYGVYAIITSRNIEFEYILTNGEMDIDKITAKRRRKRVVTINFKEVEICARIDNPNAAAQYKNTAAVSKTLSLIGDINSGNVYFADFHNGAEKIRVLFQPTEKIMENAVKFNPRCIYA